MRYEFDLCGLLVPALLVWLAVTYVIGALLRPLLERSGLYRFVWHRALFDLAFYVCLLGGVVYLSSGLLS
ncbi:DUF1656 domain-containing protein [Rhodopseudomonas sp. P2A-2r]|uniref:DUF1656 domain-containing protein n=1 Tax=unclassified Rhodopseudomonas TaxID=2638247 RepID=UPI0022346502|nr:DUF1656 domain-containing protein [Rhodopseudomonas sp. P2A-2r]UZE50373.1 DUF1656 domain-containing protein [Rhodopseudomonas sp. P2A-2r]